MEDLKGFWHCLFDLSFDELITKKIIKILYMVGIGIAALTGLCLMAKALTQSFLTGVLHVVAGPVVFVLMVVVIRVTLELLITLFKIEENTRKPGAEESASTAEAVEPE